MLLEDRVLAIIHEQPGISAAQLRALLHPDGKGRALTIAILALLRAKVIESVSHGAYREKGRPVTVAADRIVHGQSLARLMAGR
jgi:hypothetical protein